jgi:spermidine synthase
MLVIVQMTLFSSQAFGGHKEFTETLFEENSLYQFIMVDEDFAAGQRYILVNTKKDRPQGGIFIDDPDKLLFEYTRLAFTSLVFLDRKPEDVLFVGLGAGVMPRYFNKYYPEANVDAVEIDPVMVEVAKEFFYFQEKTNLKVHTVDGRVYIKRTKNKYDMIFLDAYSGENIPFHLTTVEFLRELKGKLKEGGVVVSNVLSKSNNKYFWSMIKTYKKEFKSLYLFAGESSGNYIFVATVSKVHKANMKKSVFRGRARTIQSASGMDVDLDRRPWDYERGGFGWDAKVLTDDFAPVNLYKHMKLDK